MHQSYNPRMSTRKLRAAQLLMLCSFYGVANVLRPKRVLGALRTWRGKDEEATQFDALLRQRRRGLGSGRSGAPARA